MSKETETLWALSRQATFNLLEAKFWNIAQNPFSRLPPKIVQDLEVFVRSRRGFSEEKESFDVLNLLFQSGHIEKFDVFHWNSRQIQKRLPNILTKTFCRNLISLSLPKHFYAICPVESILSTCSKLVEVHLPVFVDLDVFENCPELEILRFHATDDEFSNYFLKNTGEIPFTIRKLRVLTVCNTQSHFAVTKDIIAKLLLNCPKLESVGCCNSLDAFQYIRETQDDLPNPLHLQRCYWGLKYSDFIPASDTPNLESYQTRFSRMVKTASLMCSSLQELVIDVYDNNCVQHLVRLKNLTVLSINYEDPYDEMYQPAFVSLLREIGSQLKHLSVSAQNPVPLDIICKRCCNLESLRILGEVTISNHKKKWKKLPDLRSFCVSKIQGEYLHLLFQRCPNIKELFIGSVLDFNDDFLEILSEDGSLPKLEIVSVETCSLSKDGFMRFMKSVPTLQKVSFDRSMEWCGEELMDEIKTWVEALGKTIEVDKRLYKKEYFRVKIHPCVF
ncbi:unnamed protein product [Larinioides sclopetarius]|uniref:Uncharacterized protein n=1 Tax=Larinioides sclopetarius TaxID=280406 RepID=A0AAV2B7G3_9ARAC